jgi:REP element-mobilizing transposase RayT
MKQVELPLRRWGGKRKGAGRKPNGAKAGVSHLSREPLRRVPIHVNWRMRSHVWNLRAKRCFRPIRDAFFKANDRFGMRLLHFSVQGNHIHLIVEAESEGSLSKGMQGLGIRIAKKLNKVMDQHGQVMADRYFALVLRSPTQVRNAVTYVLRNHQKHHHLDLAEIDQCSSQVTGAPVVAARTWLGKKWIGFG